MGPTKLAAFELSRRVKADMPAKYKARRGRHTAAAARAATG
jgi:hypothetical protein